MNKINKYNYNFYLTNTEPCPYLTNRDEKKIFLIMDDINKSNEYEHLIKSGFRRSHNILYNQVCADCNLCKSIRINVNNFKSYIKRRALGIVFVIAPWNYPYLVAVNSIIPAMAAGNSVILKHSAQTPLCAEQLYQSAKKTLPKDVIQL